MSPKKLLKRILTTPTNVCFGEFTVLVKAFGFHWDRVAGSHHIYKHPSIPELLSLQEYQGQAKPYQIRQFLRLVERYNLKLENDK